MANLTAVLRKTIDGFPRHTPHLRAKVYEKAHNAIQRQINAAEPPLPPAIARQRYRVLDDAIREAEAWYTSEEGGNFEPATGQAAGWLSDDESGLPPIEDQAPHFIQFKPIDDDRLDVNLRIGADEIQDDRDARDRHSETIYAVTELIRSYDASAIGSNGAVGVLTAAERLLEALGDSIKSVRPGLLIPRGEALRIRHATQLEASDDLYAAPPLPAEIANALALVVSTYNAFVSLDPELSRQDAAMLGPEGVAAPIDKDTGLELAESAHAAGIVTKNALEAIRENASVVAGTGYSFDRRSRRFAEGVRNLARAILSTARSAAWMLRSAYGIVSAAGLVAVGAAKWAIAHEEVIMWTFSANPIISEFMIDLFRVLKTLSL